ncbi:hypothetical protein P775_03645 [Puniceibacterium antarcticum]|uniref:GHMP kinase N-terminal domain-containing protein n=1 Tax=Puniceibacterium antarcticum TaxID=1206336 RepID=A0A2G8RJ12_9RHOB|nr:hypothetical protein P775_03645 [Puniceibacterium antarcticum]
MKVKKAVQVYRSLHLVPEDLDFIIDIESNIPSGIGMGSSTADIVATLRAMDQAYGQHTELEDLVGLVLQVEKACDSTMLDHRVRLFAQRDGKVLENFGCRLPPLYVLGFNMMPGEVFKTDDMPPANYSREELARFDQLLSMLRIAVHAGDCRKIAEIATESALINERKYPKRNFGYLMDIRTALNAAGVCVSHSGTIAGLIFPINELPCPATLTEVSSEVRSWGGEYLGLYRM